VKWLPGIGPSAKYFEMSEDGQWIVNTVAGISTLVRLGGKRSEIVCSGSLEHCKGVASDRNPHT
jgi:hypothetical protein